MPGRVLRLLRGHLRAADAARVAVRVRDEVLPITDGIEGLLANALAVRESADRLELFGLSVWRDRTALDLAVDRPPASNALASLGELIDFDAPQVFELVGGYPADPRPMHSGTVGCVEVTVKPDSERSALELIAGQQLTLEADGQVRSLFVGRRDAGAAVELVAVALWPDRDALAAFLAGRSNGPGIDPRFSELADSIQFGVFDLVDPRSPQPELGVPAVFALDVRGTIVDASRGVERLLGTPAEGWLGKPFAALIASEAPPELAEVVRSLPEVADFMLPVVLADGAAETVRCQAIAHVPAPGLVAILLAPAGVPPYPDPEATVRGALGGWRASAVVAAPPRIARSAPARPLPRLITLPSGDRVFGRFTTLAIESFESPSMRRLQLHLRGLYPQAVVHRRELSSEEETWYVFRDGRVAPSPLPDRWWLAPDAAHVSVDQAGRIAEGNPAAAALYGVAPGTLVGQDVRGLGTAGSYEEFAQLLAIAFEEGIADSTVRLLSASGDPIDIVFHAERDGRLLRLGLARMPGPERQRTWFAPLCLPPWDDAFVARVESLCARLAPKDADEVASELEVRLQVLYPSATVRPLGRLTGFGAGTEVLLVHRDGEPERGEHWWLAPDVARVTVEGGRYVDANDAALELHGVSRDELLASPLGRFRLSGDERLLMRDVLNRTGALHTTARLERGDGRSAEIEFRATMVNLQPRRVEIVMRPIPARYPDSAAPFDGAAPSDGRASDGTAFATHGSQPDPD